MQVLGITVGLPIPVPILAGAVRAGFPSPADDFVQEEIDLQRLLIANRPATFLVRVAGDSMLLARLHESVEFDVRFWDLSERRSTATMGAKPNVGFREAPQWRLLIASS